MRVLIARRFVGIRVGGRYFKLRDVTVHRLLFTERNGRGYRRLGRWRDWELGVRY